MEANNFHGSHEGRDTSYLFLLKFCSHRWLENTKAITQIMEIWNYIGKFFTWLEENKKILSKDEILIIIRKALKMCSTIAILEFCLCILKEVEPFLELF